MTFEEAMESLGAELGVPLPVEDGKTTFEAASTAGDKVIEIEIVENSEFGLAVITADLGAMPEENSEALMMEMLEANHLFGGTGGSTFSVEGGRVKLERYVLLSDLGGGEGSKVIMPFLRTARHWAGVLLKGTMGNN